MMSLVFYKQIGNGYIRLVLASSQDKPSFPLQGDNAALSLQNKFRQLTRSLSSFVQCPLKLCSLASLRVADVQTFVGLQASCNFPASKSCSPTIYVRKPELWLTVNICGSLVHQ